MKSTQGRKAILGLAGFILVFLSPYGCVRQSADLDATDTREVTSMEAAGNRNIVASNAFFYYRDLEAAEQFYSDILGLKTVADYGFAKILRIARTSYLTLVDAESGMHSADEPKTVAIALITDQLDEWYGYLRRENVPMKSGYNPVAGRPHHGFVVYDPEGYYLEFERFNPHPENETLIPMLAALKTVYPEPGAATRCPGDLGFKATILWLYYKDMQGIQEFWREVFGFRQVVDQGWAKIYAVSPTGFLGPVDETRGMHSWTEKKAVTVSFITDDLDGWFGYLGSRKAFEMRTPAIEEEERAGARVFIGYDPEGYFLEFDSFLERKENELLLALLKKGPAGN